MWLGCIAVVGSTGCPAHREAASGEPHDLNRHDPAAGVAHDAPEVAPCSGASLDAAAMWDVPDELRPEEFVVAVARDGISRIDLSRHAAAAALLHALSEAHAMESVRELQLARAGLAATDVAHLAASSHLTCLERVDLGDNAMADEGFAALCKARMPRLRELLLPGAKLTGTSLSELAGCAWIPTLTALSLAKNDFSQPAPTRRVAKGRLARVDLVRSHCRAPCLQTLTGSGVLATLEDLVLEDFFGPAETRALMQAGWQRLARLALYGMRDLSEEPEDVLGDDGLGLLATSRVLATVIRLEIAGHAIGNRGATALASSSVARTLRHLVLRDNAIGDPGAQALMDGPTTRALDHLDLRGNPISPALKTALRNHYGTKVLLTP